MVSGTLVGAQQGPLFTQQIGVCLMRSSLVSTEEISDNVGQGFLSQNVCTTVCVCPYMFLGRASIISIIFSNGSLKFIHLKDFLPSTNQAWGSVLGVAVHTGSRWTRLGCDWGLGWEMVESAF